MAQAFIGLGANLGGGMDALAQQLRQAIARLHALPGIQVTRISGAYRSAPVDANGPDFLNAVVQLQTSLLPLELLDGLQAIEAEFGRERLFHNAPRTLDLDLLWYDALVLNDPRLTLPHPRAAARSFVMLPLAELTPSLVWSEAKSVQELAASISGQRIERLGISLELEGIST